MSRHRRMFSICIPAYNRARYLPALLDSLFIQDYDDFEVVICEDKSPEREQISSIVKWYSERHPGKLFYYENEENLGYDGNIRNLIEMDLGSRERINSGVFPSFRGYFGVYRRPGFGADRSDEQV